jgi:ribosome-associated toxin RatA of RatAB toxin-antitoxin module
MLASAGALARTAPRAAVLCVCRALLVWFACGGIASGQTAEAPAPDWPLSAAQRAAVERREVVVVSDARATSVAQDRAPEATPPVATGPHAVRAAVLIDAEAPHVYALMTSCAAALQYVPSLRRCRVVARTADGSSEDIEHEVDYGWLLPAVRYTFRARYEPAQRITFDAVEGDLRVNEGRWELRTQSGGRQTLVTYRVRLVPRFAVPQWMVRAALRRELPALLEALRAKAERVPEPTAP